ncbi:Protein slit [Frankliniella fusca]|uniref:Protein slit n=1 Tax=Frankliniella fusca TaxID=407009 RepID=A0AAE1LN34_9NEOP|nr:Protein slit [Frankliniella fusca]
MTAVFLLALLLAGTLGALGAVPAPVATAVTNEAASALQLLSPFLLSQNSTLIIYGSANWTGSFVHALPPGVARTLLPDAARFWERRFNHRIMTKNRVFLIVAESPADPRRLLKKYLNYERTVFWFRGGGFDGVTLANSVGIPDFTRNEFQLPDRSLHHIVAIVPAGLGPVVNPLSAVALEFSPAVWLCTALAALGTAAALAWALRRDRGAALLLALGPLLGQAPPPPPAASRSLHPLLGAWLLVCVVLVAAYQGLLLGMLSSARPRGEIDSLQALKDSGLSIHLTLGGLRRMQGSDLLAELMDRGTVLSFSSVPDFLLNMALHKNSALIVLFDRNVQRLVNRLSIPDIKLHTFPLGRQHIKIIAWAAHGSPFAGPITTTYRRLVAGGLLQHWENVLDEPGRRARARHLVSLPLAAPLTLDNMKPAFVVLAAGFALAGLVFAIELLVAWSGPAGLRARHLMDNQIHTVERGALSDLLALERL